jgi:hypothetical protein
MPAMSANQRIVRTRAIKKLIKTHGSAYKAALALEVTPQAFYERMERLGLSRTKRTIVGEPKGWKNQRSWMTGLLNEKKSIAGIAQELGCCREAVQARLRRFGLRSTANRGVEPKGLLTPKARKAWLQGLLKKYGNANKVAKALNVTPAAVYQRCNNYGIKY